MISPREFAQTWQESIDVLEYASLEAFRALPPGSRWRRAIRFVLLGAVITSGVEAIDALVQGNDPVRHFLLSVVGAPVSFALFTLGIYLAARLLGGRASLRDLTYSFALFYVPLDIFSSVAAVFGSLLPELVGEIVLVLIGLLAAAANVYFGYLAVRALTEFPQPWRIWPALVVGALLGGLLTSLNFFS